MRTRRSCRVRSIIRWRTCVHFSARCWARRAANARDRNVRDLTHAPRGHNTRVHYRATPVAVACCAAAFPRGARGRVNQFLSWARGGQYCRLKSGMGLWMSDSKTYRNDATTSRRSGADEGAQQGGRLGSVFELAQPRTAEEWRPPFGHHAQSQQLDQLQELGGQGPRLVRQEREIGFSVPGSRPEPALPGRSE